MTREDDRRRVVEALERFFDRLYADELPQAVGEHPLMGAVYYNIVTGPDLPGAAPTENPVLVAGWDGTNVRRLLLAADGSLAVTGGSSGLVTGTVTGTGAALNATPIAATDAAGYRSVSVGFTTGFTGTVVFEESPDGTTNWLATTFWYVAGVQGSNSNGAVSLVNPATGGIYFRNLSQRYFRVRISAYTSGTVACTAFFSSSPTPQPCITADTELPAAVALSDTLANPTTPPVGACMMRWTGSVWVRDHATKGTPSAAAAVAPTTTATLLLAANANRVSALFTNNGAGTVYVGPTSAVTTATGHPVATGQPFSDNSTTSAWYGIMASGTGDVRVTEVS